LRISICDLSGRIDPLRIANRNSKIEIHMRYIPNSPEERAEMLDSIGLSNSADLFRSIPSDVQLGRGMKITDPLAEPEVLAEMDRMAARNTAATKPSFLGAGVYSHFSPTIVDHLIQRSEFFTSYTPYQPEISQGTLQYIFEFQTLICQLTGMEVANASMYDGSTAMAEAYVMAQRVTRRNKIVVAESVHPEYRQVAETYTQHGDAEIVTAAMDAKTGRVADLSALDDSTARVYREPGAIGRSRPCRGGSIRCRRYRGHLFRPAQAAGGLRSRYRRRRGTVVWDPDELRRPARRAVRYAG